MTLQNKKIVTGMTGGIACYKVPYLVRALKKAGAEVRVIMTDNAMRFITPLTMETVSKYPVATKMFPDEEFVSTRHIELAVWPDLTVIAPATANILGKVVSGIADDLLSTILCATAGPVLAAPAMNPHMWNNPVTQRNVKYLKKELHWLTVGPNEGEMAEDQWGVGRMAEPDEIFRAVVSFFEGVSKKKLLSGKRALVTAGPCREPIDPVRYISNRSSGKMGYAVARAAQALGAETTLVSGPTSLTTPQGVKLISIETTEQMQQQVERLFDECDLLVMAAAPGDFHMAQVAPHKIKRSGNGLTLELQPSVDILKGVATRKRSDQCIMGFAVETENELENARKKLHEKNLDVIVINNPQEAGAGFDHDTNRVTIVTREGAPERWPLMAKEKAAVKLLELAARML